MVLRLSLQRCAGFGNASHRKLARSEGRGLCERVNALLLAEEGRRDWPLRFYLAELLFSKEALLGWGEPDRGDYGVDQFLCPLTRLIRLSGC
jgi:hypothetical protein